MLRDGVVSTTTTLTPPQYDRLWRTYRLDEYLHQCAKIRSQRICLHCLKRLADGADERQRYCGPACRNAARQKRFRQDRPERLIQIQERYWSSGHAVRVDLDAGD